MYKFYDYHGDERLSVYDLAVFTVICCNQEYCSKTADNIADLSRVSRRAVFNSIKKLEEIGLIRVEKLNARRWKIWPLIQKHSAPHAPSPVRHSANANRHSAYGTPRMVHPVHSNSNLTLKEQDDLKIPEETTREQMLRLGIGSGLKSII